MFFFYKQFICTLQQGYNLELLVNSLNGHGVHTIHLTVYINFFYFLFYLPPLMVTLFPTLMSPYKSLESKFNHCCPNIHHMNYSTIFITFRISPIYMFSLDSKHEITVNLNFILSHIRIKNFACVCYTRFTLRKIFCLRLLEKFTFSFLPTPCFYNYDSVISIKPLCVLER